MECCVALDIILRAGHGTTDIDKSVLCHNNPTRARKLGS